MSEKQFSRVFYGYERQQVDKIVADALQELEDEKTERRVNDGQRQLEDMLDLLKRQLETVKLRQTVLRKTCVYAQDFPDYLQNKAQGIAQDVLKEAEGYVKGKEKQIADVVKKTEEVEKHLAMVYKEINSILSAVPTDSVVVQDSGAKIIPFVGAVGSVASNEAIKNKTGEVLAVTDDDSEININNEIGEQAGRIKREINAAAAETAAVEQTSVNIAELKVLIVEEDETVARLLTAMLAREGFIVTVANDGNEAMNLINTMPPPHIAMLEFMLPYISGLQLLKHIRTNPKWDNVAAIMIADSSAERDVIFALKNGADDYIQKPFNPRELAVKLIRFAQRMNVG